MTVPAIRPGIVFLTDEGIMYVIMTINALHPNLPEAPFFFFFMTNETGCRQVSAFQLKSTLIVSLYRE